MNAQSSMPLSQGLSVGQQSDMSDIAMSEVVMSSDIDISGDDIWADTISADIDVPTGLTVVVKLRVDGSRASDTAMRAARMVRPIIMPRLAPNIRQIFRAAIARSSHDFAGVARLVGATTPLSSSG